ncbi:DUF1178 family protein [Roseovarius sp. 2305UL8-3]|uniref:DUF1178 family protein n=1 Tax=Roseovarius conchicola TaxID=3121636 RepID=UPI0035285A05
MIQFTLKCDNDHQFDSWFQSSEAFDKLQNAGMVACAVCGSQHVEKAIMAPRIQDSRTRSAAPAETAPLSAPQSPAEQALAEMRRNIEENSEYVGLKFAQEARDMHVGDAPERAIHGEAGPEEAKALIEEGVPVTPLPFIPGRKTN